MSREILLTMENHPKFLIEIVSSSDRFIYFQKKNNINKISWLGTYIYGFPHHHRKTRLWEKVGNLADLGNNPWLIINDLNEYPFRMRKYS